MDILAALQQMGLSEKESHIYIALIKTGQVSAGTLIRLTQLKRATVYAALRSLQDQGLVTSIESDKVEVFEAYDATVFLDKANMHVRFIEGIMPSLLGLSNQNTHQPKVRYFHGKKGLALLFNEFGKSTTENMKVLLGNQFHYNDIMVDIAMLYVDERIAKNVILKRMITTSSEYLGNIAQDEVMKRETKILHGFPIELSSDMNIFGPGKVSFLFFDDKRNPHCVLIESHKIRETCNALFDFIRSKI